MLIVGGLAALTAITVYLAWHFLRQWRAAKRRADRERSHAEHANTRQLVR